MEHWEIDLRAKLEKEYEDGCYHFDNGNGFVFATGKGGAINVAVSWEKVKRGLLSLEPVKGGDGIIHQIPDSSNLSYKEHSVGNEKGTTVTEQDFVDAMREIMWGKGGNNG